MDTHTGRIDCGSRSKSDVSIFTITLCTCGEPSNGSSMEMGQVDKCSDFRKRAYWCNFAHALRTYGKH